ncbi:MAG TPA: hypothetical protein VGO59_11135 [Verrucomicrobiae bacterium]|jgi:hypothetical protein
MDRKELAGSGQSTAITFASLALPLAVQRADPNVVLTWGNIPAENYAAPHQAACPVSHDLGIVGTQLSLIFANFCRRGPSSLSASSPPAAITTTFPAPIMLAFICGKAALSFGSMMTAASRFWLAHRRD